MQIGAFLCFILIAVYSANGDEQNSSNVTIVFLGRSGSGISSTIRRIAQNNTILKASEPSTLIKEYKVQIPGQSGYLRVVDVEGFVDGKNTKDDASTLASLKSYLNDPSSGLNGAQPNFFIIVSTFDDNRLEGKSSVFTQTLKRVEILQEEMYNGVTNNNVFLLTKFMTVTRDIQRGAQVKINTFLDTIRQYTAFKDPIDIVVGENFGSNYDLEVDRDGFTKLPFGGELYPKNLFDKLIEIATRTGDNDFLNAVRSVERSRGINVQIQSKFYKPHNSQMVVDDQAKFLRKINQLNSDADDNEVNRAIETAFDNLDASSQAQAMSAKIELQAYFESLGITGINDLPKTTHKKVKLFQNLGSLTSQKLDLLKAAFNLKMPDFIRHLIVGYGYDALQDGYLEITPFIQKSDRPSRIGYVIPDFLTCSKLPNPTQAVYTYFSENVTDYIPIRYQLLGLEGRESISPTAFSGTVKSGFNLRPEPEETVVSLSAVKEFRTIECKLNDVTELTEEFRESVSALTVFNSTVRDSEKEWKGFFRKYGTHVVSSGFGGGYVEGSITSSSLKQVVSSSSEIQTTFGKIIDFEKFSFSDKPSYRFFGGNLDPRLENIYDENPSSRDFLLQNWTDSLNYDPVILQYELKLSPISFFAKAVDQNIGTEVERALNLLLSGKLLYERPKGSKPSRNQVSTTSGPPRRYVSPVTSAPVVTEHRYPESNNNNNNQNYNYPTSSPPVRPNPPQPTASPCPQVIPLTPLVPKVRPTTQPKQLRDYTDYTVGQGYHMLKEIVLPNSPFTFGGTDERNSKGMIQTVQLDKRCQIINSKSYKSQSDYINERLGTKFGILQHNIPSSVLANYKVKLPGHFVSDVNTKNKKRLRFEVERRIGETKIFVKQTIRELSIQTTQEFNKQVLGLPTLFLQPLPDCNGLTKWREFFDKFGTHFVKSTFVGHSYEIILNDVSEDEVNRVLPSNHSCDPSYRSNKWEENLDRGNKNSVLKSSFEFGSYKDMLLWNGTLAQSFDEAMFQLMRNGLACEE